LLPRVPRVMASCWRASGGRARQIPDAGLF
jgi:hypothetical protein